MKKANPIIAEHKISELAHMVFRLPSLLTMQNLKRIMVYIKLFGFKITVKEVNKKLWRGNYYLYEEIGSKPIFKNSERLKYQSSNFCDTTISVVIPVKNAGDDLRNLLSMIRNQKGFRGIEIIVVDSGSTDESIDIANAFGAKVVRIFPEEFSHSFSRNIGAKYASGNYILFTVQDAMPPSDSWLHSLFSVILDNEVVAVSCAEIPREDADLFYKALSWSHNKFMDIENRDRIMIKPEIENHLAYKKNAQLNNVACLISKDIFMNYGFRGKYAEDLDLGIRLTRDGYKLAILGSTRIIHSHKRPPYYYLKRGYIEHIHYHKLLPNVPNFAPSFDQLVTEISRIYILLDQLVNFDLNEFNVPTAIKHLSRFLMRRLHHFNKDESPRTIDLESNEYIDDNFRDFLTSFVNIKNIYRNSNNISVNRILLDNIQSYVALILEYIYDKYKVIDHQLLEEFKHDLFKAYAFIIGIQLASSFLQPPVTTNQFYKQIDEELTRQI